MKCIYGIKFERAKLGSININFANEGFFAAMCEWS